MGLTLFSGVPRFIGGDLVARPVVTTPAVLVETHFVWRRANSTVALRHFRESVQRIAQQQSRAPAGDGPTKASCGALAHPVPSVDQRD